jgi:transposase InsO family protein
MPWQEIQVVTLRREFVRLVEEEKEPVAGLCRRFGISRKTAYKWANRYSEEGDAGLVDRSRRPLQFSNQSSREVEERVLEIRGKHPSWGGRKIKAYMEREFQIKGPSASTVTAILRRHDLLSHPGFAGNQKVGRFQRNAPNELWQMDFKGDVATTDGRCYPLTVLDDYSRFSVLLQACADQQAQTVKDRLVAAFRLYGLPLQILVDNGPPWGDDYFDRHTRFTTWLMKLGIHVIHSRPRHPQTMGKDERFHRTLKAELLGQYMPCRLVACQNRFDDWRIIYNHHRPHEALNMLTPSNYYTISNRPYPETLPAIEYAHSDIVRVVAENAKISFKGRLFKVSKAFIAEKVALRPDPFHDGQWDIFFLNHKIRSIDLTINGDA